MHRATILVKTARALYKDRCPVLKVTSYRGTHHKPHIVNDESSDRGNGIRYKHVGGAEGASGEKCLSLTKNGYDISIMLPDGNKNFPRLKLRDSIFWFN